MQRPFIILLQAWLSGVDFKKATSCLKVAPLVEKWEMQHWVSAFCSWCNFNPLHCIDEEEGQRSPERSHYSSCVKWSRPLQNCLSFCLTLPHHLLSLSPFGLVLSLSLNPQSHLTSSHQRKGQQEQEHIRGDFQWDASSRRTTVRWWWRSSQIKEGTPNLFQHQSEINYINYALCLLFIRETLIIIASRVLAYTVHLFACH